MADQFQLEDLRTSLAGSGGLRLEQQPQTPQRDRRPSQELVQGKADTQTHTEATLNLMNNLLGAGLLAMPRAFSHSGIFVGLLVMLVMSLANRYTLLMTLDLSQSQFGGCSFQEMGRRVFGQKGLLAVLLAYFLFTGGVLSAYLIAITDILIQLPGFETMPRFFLVLTAVAVCTPGSCLRSLSGVAKVSGLCMVGVIMLVVVLTGVALSDAWTMEWKKAPLDDRGRQGNVYWLGADWRTLLDGVCLFALQFSVQAGGIEVLSALPDDEASMAAGGGHAAAAPAAAIAVVSPTARRLTLEESPAQNDALKDGEERMESGLAGHSSSGSQNSPSPDEDSQAGQADAEARPLGDMHGGAMAASSSGGEVVSDGVAKGMAVSEQPQASTRRVLQSSFGPQLPRGRTHSDSSTSSGLPSARQRAAAQVSTMSFLGGGICMAVMGMAGYLRFGDAVRGDVLLSFGARAGGDSSLTLAVARCAYGTVVICSFAFMMVPCRCAALDVFALRRRDLAASGTAVPTSELFNKATMVILSVCSVIAWLVSDLALMLEFVGVWSTMALSFILPCGFLLEWRRQEGTPVFSAVNALPLVLLTFGLFVTALGTCQLVQQILAGEED